MSETNTYSLWLMPEGVIYARTNAIIKKLHNRYGGPLFEPHITLLSSIMMTEEEAVRYAESLNQKIHSIPVRLIHPSYGNDFFHCFYLEVDLSRPLIDARKKAEDIFGYHDPRPFHPHMSLMYGDVDLRLKQDLVKEFEHIRRWEFIVEHINLIKTGDRIEEWEEVGSYTI